MRATGGNEFSNQEAREMARTRIADTPSGVALLGGGGNLVGLTVDACS
jgi:hypothetical protein